MIQAAMYFALGLLTAGLLALLVMPAIWRRTARLTRQRIESSVPMTFAEIQADKDQLRAEFAMSARRLEMTADRLRDKTTEQVIEINQKRAEIVRLTNELNDKTKTIEELDERAAALGADLKSADERFAEASERISAQQATLAEREADLDRTRTELGTSQQLTDEQKLEIVARNTEIGNLNDRLLDAKATEERIAAERDQVAKQLSEEQETLAAERRRIANLEASLARIEGERIERLTELERRATEARELVAELARNRTRTEDLVARVRELEAERSAKAVEYERRIAEYETGENASRSVEFENAGNQIAGAPLVDGDNIAKAIAATEAENAALTAQLAEAETEQSELRAENEHLRRMMSSDWDIETENALLRERLASVAADVLRLAEASSDAPPKASLHDGDKANGNGARDQPDSVVATLHPPGPANESVPPDDEASASVRGKTLAERLRALQHTAAGH